VTALILATNVLFFDRVTPPASAARSAPPSQLAEPGSGAEGAATPGAFGGALFEGFGSAHGEGAVLGSVPPYGAGHVATSAEQVEAGLARLEPTDVAARAEANDNRAEHRGPATPIEKRDSQTRGAKGWVIRRE
jgi:hypothetical protein